MQGHAGAGVPRPVWQQVAIRLIRLELKSLVVVVLAYAIISTSFPDFVMTARAAEPRVVVIVGPAGAATDSYRAEADRAARTARADGAVVETIYSPDATWPRVKAALQGASVVVYLGHGNGFPSTYRKDPYPKTQNGLGLNPEAGVDDDAHQYFGEAYLARYVKLAPNAVVLLHHLCYASGNSEPGLPEGDLATAEQRVDNFAAGWLASGAGAVVADAFAEPAYYMHRILTGKGSIESIWRKSPTAHGNVLAFESQRTPGLTALMDPTHASSGFYRSMVGHAKLKASEVAVGASLVSRPVRATTVTPAPRRTEPTVAGVVVEGVPTVGSVVRLTLSIDDPGSYEVADLGLGVRWTPLALDRPSPAVVAAPDAASPDPTAPDAAAPTATDALDTSVGSSVGAPPIDLVTPEVPGAVVELRDVKAKGHKLTAELAVPLEPGLYRLVVTLHDRDGVALSRKTQDRIAVLIVKATARLSAVVSTADRLVATAGSTVAMPVTIANTGDLAWVSGSPPSTPKRGRPDVTQGRLASVLVGHWLRLDGVDEASSPLAVMATVRLDPGAREAYALEFEAPAEPGNYLLVLDVVSPLYGSITAVGGDPIVVRVRVVPVAADGTATPVESPPVSP